ncbi:unnamed protein product [Peniophora sp. CBMAI 1063]|nr:unnamed protein product [Peniophora sp. CBMAI 1063]
MADRDIASIDTSEFRGFEVTSLIFNGIYLYDFLCFMPFDWSLVLRQKEGQGSSLLAKSVKAIYLCCRCLLLLSSVTEVFILFRASHGSLPCQVLMRLTTGTACLAATFSSALIGVRAMVVWSWDARVATLIVLILVLGAATNIRIFLVLSSSYNPILKICDMELMYTNLPNILALLVCDYTILICLLTGLYRWHTPGRGVRAFRLWSVLWSQGVIYLTLASVLEIPAVVLLFFNLNPVMDTMLLRPMVIILVIVTTHFYRSLSKFTPNHTHDSFTERIRFATVDVGVRFVAEEGASELCA